MLLGVLLPLHVGSGLELAELGPLTTLIIGHNSVTDEVTEVLIKEFVLEPLMVVFVMVEIVVMFLVVVKLVMVVLLHLDHK